MPNLGGGGNPMVCPHSHRRREGPLYGEAPLLVPGNESHEASKREIRASTSSSIIRRRKSNGS